MIGRPGSIYGFTTQLGTGYSPVGQFPPSARYTPIKLVFPSVRPNANRSCTSNNVRSASSTWRKSDAPSRNRSRASSAARSLAAAASSSRASRSCALRYARLHPTQIEPGPHEITGGWQISASSAGWWSYLVTPWPPKPTSAASPCRCSAWKRSPTTSPSAFARRASSRASSGQGIPARPRPGEVLHRAPLQRIPRRPGAPARRDHPRAAAPHHRSVALPGAQAAGGQAESRAAKSPLRPKARGAIRARGRSPLSILPTLHRL